MAETNPQEQKSNAAKFEDVDVRKEESLLDPEMEKSGCEKMWKALTEEELEELVDANMPLRHLRAEKGNVEKGTKKLKAALGWRKEFGVDKIISAFEERNGENSEEEMRKILRSENSDGKVYCRGYDKSGRATVYLIPAKDTSKNELNKMRHLVYNIERAIASTNRRSNGTLEKYNIVLDYTGFTLRNAPTLSESKYTLNILQNQYPERLHRAYLFKPPFVFRTFYNLIYPFIDPITREKIIFCHGKTGLDKLEAAYDLSTLEAGVGGTGHLRPFDSEEFLSSPFNTTFDETE